ncbi:MAG: DUF1501 domain-containing protein [Cytophagia bacterium]|nr:MAG: DUF1501 domain-containing protein [Runella sp.]TAG18885.1 MAG: DUF1501 domain-containing protein [Cytophagales bacterium]TAG38308.1 MAG: DUF1501 domain-containing protein [Cytophagia bacterium]TAG51099.1 MAG: DUF1501 domain-containing protein [Runella slithyformis]TAG79853.1 MAG: DUF1501 domain-containing protein [Cytophagales bacterium]
MNRKEFLHQLGLLSGGVAFGMGGVPVKAFAHNPLGINMEGTNGRILVLVQLGGGNDGLNTVVPFENDTYYNKRPNIAIKKEAVLGLNSQTGLNPAMGALKELYDKGKVSVVQNVGYERPNRSHFRSTDIWLSGSDSVEVLDQGWVGRYLSKMYPAFPVQAPEEPMAIQLGSVESMLLQTDLGSTGVTFSDPNTFYALVQGSTADTDPLPDTLAGDELKFMRQIATQSIKYSDIIKTKATAGKNQVTYPSLGIGPQLKIVASLITGGLQTPIYLTTIGGFDTHANQVVTGNTTTGSHANLLRYVAEGIAAFQRDMEKSGMADKVTIMTFSEFGRRVNQNGTMGTDHGTAAPLFVVGNTVRGGIIGKSPSLTDVDSSGDIKYQFDYRQIYASVLQDHLGVSSQITNGILGNKDFSTLPIFKSTTSPLLAENPDLALEQNFPNPFVDVTRLRYMLNKSMYMKLAVYDLMGKELLIIREGQQDAGTYTIPINGSNWASGFYLCSLKTDAGQQVIRMVKN